MSVNASVEEQLDVLGRGIVPRVWEDMKKPLAEKLKKGKPLLVKCGFDPTAPDLHLGHTVVMRKMRQFQEFGHNIVFLVGDFTAMIGDPTGKSATRPPLTKEMVDKNAETYKSQVFKILDKDTTTVDFNSRWLNALAPQEIIALASKYTVARLMERNDFRTRYENNKPISVHEFLYPLMQAYDSVALKADVELGGNDQLFNLMVGRTVMKEYGLESQVVLTTQLLVGTDGQEEKGELIGEKMSKSLGNYVGVDDPPAGENGIFGKLMGISDPLMWHYYELLSGVSEERFAQLKAGHPKEAKVALAMEMTALYHGEDAAKEAKAEFDRLHPAAGASRGVPDDIETVAVASEDGKGVLLCHGLAKSGLAQSNSAARRLIAQGGISVDGEKVTSVDHVLPAGAIYTIKAGKRRFRKLDIS